MNILKKRYSRIKNLPSFHLERDFIFNTFSLLFLILLAGIGIAIFQMTGFGFSDMELQGIILAALVSGIVIAIISVWNMLLFALLAGWIVLFQISGSMNPFAYLVPAVAVMASSTTQLMYHWDKAVILRLGKFK